jgi:hypothetical protein
MKDQPEINGSNHSINHNPLKFLDTIDDYKHIVLFYEEPESGRMIQFRFIKNGLLKGQHSIYTTHEDTDISLIENEMTNSGIDVEGSKKKNLLQIRQIPDPRNYQEGSVIGYDNIVKGILADLKQHSIFRMVSRAIPEVKNEEQIVDELDVERSDHSSFGSFGGSLLCSYLVEGIESRKRGKWIAELLQKPSYCSLSPKVGRRNSFQFEVTLLCCTTILMITQQLKARIGL